MKCWVKNVVSLLYYWNLPSAWGLWLSVPWLVPGSLPASVPWFIPSVLSLPFCKARHNCYNTLESGLWKQRLSKCGIKAELISFALNVILTFHLFIYYSKWAQTRDWCAPQKTITIQFIEINWKHCRDASFNSWPEIKMKWSVYWLIKRRHL